MQQSANIFVIDRFEGSFAVLESMLNCHFLQINKASLPSGAREGSCVFIGEDNAWLIDAQATQERAASIIKKQRKLFRS